MIRFKSFKFLIILLKIIPPLHIGTVCVAAEVPGGAAVADRVGGAGRAATDRHAAPPSVLTGGAVC